MIHHTRFLITLCLLALLGHWATAVAGLGGQQRATMLSERIWQQPSDPALYLRRALIYADIGEFRQAFADVDTAAELGPVADTQFVRGVLMYRLGQFDPALALLDRFLAAQPQHSNALLYRARVLRDAGQFRAALRDYLAYFPLNPNATPGDYLMAARLMVMLSKLPDSPYSPEDALALLDQRRKAVGFAPQLQRYAIEIETARCHSQAAVKRLQALHANAKRAPRWQLQIAEQMLLLGDTSAVRAALNRAEEQLALRRPTASKTRLMRRHEFLTELLANHLSGELTQDRARAVFNQHYPDADMEASERHYHGADSGPHRHGGKAGEHVHDVPQAPAAHHHALLDGFEQPAASRPPRAEASHASVQSFFACLAGQLP